MNFEAIAQSFEKWLSEVGVTQIINAIITAIIGIIVVKIILSIIKKSVSRSRMRGLAGKLIINVSRVFFIIGYLLIVLKALGVDTTSLVAMLAAGLLAVSLALEQSLSNIASGMVLVANRTLKEGDYVSLGGIEGEIVEITLFATKLISVDKKEISIPNSVVAGAEITNFSKQPKRRVDIVVDVAYGTNVKRVEDALTEVLDENKFVLHDEDYTVRLKEFGDSSLQFVCRSFCKNEDYWDAWFSLHEEIVNKFEDEHIEIPFNQLDVNIVKE